jgi:dTDP-4-dehydrorhamnose reductase
MANILILGGTGLIGAALAQRLTPAHQVTVTYAHNAQGYDPQRCAGCALDVTEAAAPLQLMQAIRPAVVFHAAGHANVDFCERNPEAAHRSNVLGTAHVIDACRAVGARLIYISTNAVFDGEHAPYDESATPHPLNRYGQFKLAGEQLVAASGLDYAIARLILSYGWQPPGARLNPLSWIVASLQQGKALNLVNDVYENPLWAASAAEGLWAIAERGRQTLYHLAGATILNRYDFAVAVAHAFGLPLHLLTPVPSAFFPSIAPRPKNTSYLTTRLQTELGWQPVSIAEGLAQAFASRPVT